MTAATKLSTGAYYLKRGDTFDPEDHRMTHRLTVARRILASLGIESAVRHSENRHHYFKDCDYRCKTEWPALATNEVFNAAFSLACAVQDAHGEIGQAEINRLRAERFATTN